MEKDFDKWNNRKKELEANHRNYLFDEGDIWWLTVGHNLKNETCGKGENFRRPVLVLKKLSKNTFIGIPLSTKIKTGTWYVNYLQGGIKFTALIYQIRMFDSIRFQRRVGYMDERDFGEIKKRLKFLLNL